MRATQQSQRALRLLGGPPSRARTTRAYSTQPPSAAVTSLSASSLVHSAGPASTARSHPCGSTSTVAGMPLRPHCARSRPSRIPPRARPRLPPLQRKPIGRADESAPAVVHRLGYSSALPINGRAMSNKMWGGRFGAEPDAIMEEINASIGVDRALYPQDIAASKAHAEMLARQGIISRED